MGYISEILNTKDLIFHGVGTAGSNFYGVNERIKLKDILIFVVELIVFLCIDF